ncbi:hypothetical protein SLEP1_g55731 [Rubroshorea leprosula]|uniref:Secreted protein n=1 Tax=Rubroshorea leprosula TaxID=152421 RepID=A0AAV5MKI4_9ROSI|nr:hypothetical protein SLEP1_g55731 [Rubroshorea leprosula]
MRFEPCPILLFFSFLPAAATRRKKKGNPALALRKTGKQPDFILLFWSKNLIWNPEISPPAGKSESALLCSVLPPAAPALWG